MILYDSCRARALVGESTEWRGYFITSRRFYHLPVAHTYGYNRLPEFNSEIQNVHTLFKKDFAIKETPIKSAKLFITGDDLYKLCVNSEFVGEGPAQSYPFAYNYNCYDVTDLLSSGENSIFVHVYYSGLFNIYLMSADNLCGLIAQLEIEYADGSREYIVSDKSWKYKECEAFSSRFVYGYQTQFSEDIDLGKYKNDLFGEEGWESAYNSAKPYPIEYNLVPQITPPVVHYKVKPEKILKINGGYFFDFGKEITATLAALFNGNSGDKVEIRFGEELDGEGRVKFELRANCTYSDIITLSGNEDFLDYFDYKGFRYAEILNAPDGFSPDSVYAFVRHYPVPERCARFSSSSEEMNKIWDICTHGVKIGTQDTYYDCPTREKGGFVGDALVTGLSHLIMTGDARIYKKFILDCKNSSRYCPAIMAHLPTYNINILADYSSLIPLFLKEYYNYTADKEFLSEMLPIAEGVWDYYSEFLNSDGLLENIRHMDKVPREMEPILIDWPQNLRDGYDMEKSRHGICTAANMFFYGFLKTLAELYEAVGNSERAAELTSIYTRMGDSLIRYAYDAEKKIFRDTPDSEHSALHANALQLFFELPLPDGYDSIKNMIMERRLNCGVYFAYFVISGLYRCGYRNEAFDLLLGDDEHSWINMLRSGATSCMEAWGPEQKWNTSWCHPWSSSPIYFYTSEIMGVKPFKPGMKSIKISPKIPESIDFIDMELPLPSGMLRLSYKRLGEKALYAASAPEDTEIVFEGEGVEFRRE